MLDETHYLCRVPSYDIIVMFNEKDYRQERLVESRRDAPEYNIVLLTQGTKKLIRMYYDLIGEDNNVS